MRLVLGTLRMPPDMFWRLTLPELDAVLRGAFPDTPPVRGVSRSNLAALMARFPDSPTRSNDR
jgi:uncharacterized phage protein (TIGR02216 family)